ncbi:IS3 family transposase [Bradyrhizobium zhanjiangense]|uniref:HTH-like domain-containing protein n=1 Tax=Bradyrhizobium zhanjiangense TaxID=1325107 RepID=A0ABY0D9C7_9BRAD|nr:IS3 family transposase [Bradyrhizobium zhanjiangense]RXG86626.1 hypothetical protein EAS62_37085 [Bradyrhizobium zhanjiangense]
MIIEREFFSEVVRKMSALDRHVLVDHNYGELSVRRQCQLLGVARSSVYRPRSAANDNDDLALMRRIDELFTSWTFLGSRRVTTMLRAEGRVINRKRVQRLMRKMGIAALGPNPGTTTPVPGHKNLPWSAVGPRDRAPQPALVRRHPPTVRSTAASFISWRSWTGHRSVLAWRLSNTMDVSFCVDALQEAFPRFGWPEIFNTHHASQFTSAALPAC